MQVPRYVNAKPAEHDGVWHYPEDPSDYKFWAEKCFVRVKNCRDAEPTTEDIALTKKTSKVQQQQPGQDDDPLTETPFEIEKVPNKSIVIPAQSNASKVSALVYNPGKSKV